MLTTVEAVIERLGGPAHAAELAGVTPAAVSNWKARGRIPTEHYMRFSRALAEAGADADPAIFGFTAEAAE
jgi:hypothetical protein